MRTYSPKASEITRSWHIVDADGLTLGRMATEVARILRGKHKPMYTPNLDCGDHVIIINAAKVHLSSNKAERELVHDHSGFPGGLTSRTMGEAIARKPADAVRRTVKGMLPSTKLGAQMLTKLKVYPGAEHPHQSQKPAVLDLADARRSA